MSTPFTDIEVVVVVPNAGARDELLELRPRLIAEYEAAFAGRFDASLSETPDGEWVDVWRWVDRADAEYALRNREVIPSFARWEQLVELRSLTWAKVLRTSGA